MWSLFSAGLGTFVSAPPLLDTPPPDWSPACVCVTALRVRAVDPARLWPLQRLTDALEALQLWPADVRRSGGRVGMGTKERAFRLNPAFSVCLSNRFCVYVLLSESSVWQDAGAKIG